MQMLCEMIHLCILSNISNLGEFVVTNQISYRLQMFSTFLRSIANCKWSQNFSDQLQTANVLTYLTPAALGWRGRRRDTLPAYRATLSFDSEQRVLFALGQTCEHQTFLWVWAECVYCPWLKTLFDENKEIKVSLQRDWWGPFEKIEVSLQREENDS